MKIQILAILAAGAIFVACQSTETNPEKLQYPVTQKSDTIHTYHGIGVPDPYYWLENDTSTATAAWVEAQNKVTFGFLDKIEWRDELKKRLESLINYERISAPFREGA